MDELSLSHTKYNCKYRIVFTPKCRRVETIGNVNEEVIKRYIAEQEESGRISG